MQYEVIIIGAGPAGLACGVRLARAGRRCLILERRTALSGKVCGDGLSSHCVHVLKQLEIPVSDLLSLGGKKVLRNITSNFGHLEQRYYCASEEYESYAIGLSRDVFDPYLLRLAQEAGCEVKLSHPVEKIEKKENIYLVDETFQAANVVLACGASGGRRFGVPMPRTLPAGISARVYGDCNLAPDAFYFKYDWQFGTGYAWLFPVGERLWNYGVWSADRRRELKKLFAQLEQRLQSTYFASWSYERTPGGALIGAVKGSVQHRGYPCIGDCQYAACYESGEGISFALETGWRQAAAILRGEPASPLARRERSPWLNAGALPLHPSSFFLERKKEPKKEL